jgi:hypothetical protein
MIDYYESRGVSNSSLSLFNYDQGGSPTKFKRNHLDRDCDFIETPSLKNGKLIHLYVEDPSKFLLSDVTAPSGKMKDLVEKAFEIYDVTMGFMMSLDSAVLQARKIVEYNNKLKDDTVIEKFNKEGKKYFDFLCDSNDKICLDKDEYKIVTGCTSSLTSNKAASDLLFNSTGYNEYAVNWKGTYGGYELNLKALIDRIVVTDDVIKLIDLKTTSKSVFKFKSSFESFRYYRQLAFYKEAIKQCPFYKGQRFEFYIVAVQTTGLYQTVVYRIDEEYIKQGEEEYLSLLNDIGECYRKDDWSSVESLDLIKE